ncbi:hypothetical protein BN1088_1431067 [Sphingobacterium sp. PM2-P1-29]|nr:hypothetical protein BN1088_1431067 [Sphingobacterium sp. PM2-P1-29]
MRGGLKQSRINYLHRKVREAGFKVNCGTREIDVYPYESFQEIPVGPRYYVNALIKAGYNVQLIIR